jgi:hypothetical protein
LNAMALYGQASASLLVGAVVTWLPIPRCGPAGIFAAVVTGFTAAPFLYGLTGPLSLTLTQLALLRLCGNETIVTGDWIAAALLVAFAAIFYPLALGLGPYDPFGWGYRSGLSLMLPVAACGVIFAWRRRHALLVMMSLDLIAYATGLFDNFWSALFDPILVMLACTRLAPGRIPMARR